jgi:hypothetical protein
VSVVKGFAFLIPFVSALGPTTNKIHAKIKPLEHKK